MPHDLRFEAGSVIWPGGSGLNWTTVGAVPDSPGLYAFTVSDTERLQITYVGLTTHLWMVTSGRRPGPGGARPGQRYGRPLYAGVTRQRINSLVARAGARTRHQSSASARRGRSRGSPSTKNS